MARVVFYANTIDLNGREKVRTQSYSFSCLGIPPLTPYREADGAAVNVTNTAFNDWLEDLEDLGYRVNGDAWWEVAEEGDELE